MNNQISLKEFTEIFNYLLDNNKRLVDDGKYPIAIGIEGNAGYGKTACMKQVAEARGMTYVSINLAELEEVADLTGLPLKEYEYIQNGEKKWIAADLISIHCCEGFEFTGQTRMSYATPAWLPREENPNGTLLVCDDYSRAQNTFCQALMTLIATGKYISWSLPKYTTIALTTNPDNADYSVNSLDAAQKSRMIMFPIRFDAGSWAEWAERVGLDSRAINFCLYYSRELFEAEKQNLTINPRSYVTFCNAISGLPEWSDSKSLATILNIAKGCFEDKDNVVGTLFTTFIANNLDKLITPEDLLLKDWSKVKGEIKRCVYTSDGRYRPEVASILKTRLLNYSRIYFGTKGSKTDVVQDRILKLIEAPEEDVMLFSKDFLFDLIKTLIAEFPGRTTKFVLNAKFRKEILS